VQKLFRFTDAVVFSFDGDAAGRRAARRALDGALPYATDVRSIKFLFLPAEHDPDSYIREFGRQAFEQCVQQAMPLSKFIVEAASENCELDTVEGRARFASQARPLWQALPDGALKRQLLTELAKQSQLESQDLAQLWAETSARSAGRAAQAMPQGDAPPPSARGTERKAGGRFRSGESGTSTKSWRSARPSPGVNLADKVGRLLLAHSHLWEQLSHEDHALLCGLPDPHGELLRWLDSHIHDQGALPWGSLHEALQDQAAGTLARSLMQDADLLPNDSAADALQELQSLLKPLRLEQLKVEFDAAVAALEATPGDPQAQQRYRELHARREALKTGQV
jgi:DNA primase